MNSNGGPAPDVEEIARSMLFLHGAHVSSGEPGGGPWSKAPDFSDDPTRAAAIAEAGRRDREHYLNDGLVQVDCRFCHASVGVKKLALGYTAVQWNSNATRRCAYFAQLRAEGGDSSRARCCPRLTDSIKHAV